MKAIIPVAGAGTRLRPHTYTQPKALIPVAGKPILSHIIEQLQSVGIEEYVFIIGYLGEKVKSFIDEKYSDLNVHFITQRKRMGVGHAIWTAKEQIDKDDEVIIILGDTIVDLDMKALMSAETSVLGVKKVQDPTSFGVATLDENDTITNLVEKPKIPKSNMALVGLYRIKEGAQLIQVLDEMIHDLNSQEEEFQLTDALMKMIEKGVKLKAHRVNGWYDLGQMDVLLETNANLLKKMGDLAQGKWQNEDSIIIEPVSIADEVVIKNAIIGPNVTVGEHSVIENSIVKNSIIGSYARLTDVTLFDSLIGNDTSVTGTNHKLNIGDNTELDLSGK